MPRPVFDTERCKACELCSQVCPKKIIALSSGFNSKGYQTAGCIDESKCIGCAFCAKMCPDSVIEIYA